MGRKEEDVEPRVTFADTAHETIASAQTFLSTALLNVEERAATATKPTVGTRMTTV